MKQIFTKIFLLRIALLLGATAIILALLPRADHQSYSYELNQPWKYPLLTAEFDTPILRDSASANKLRDSIDINFIPFIVRDASMPKKSIERFSQLTRASLPAPQHARLVALLDTVYRRGIIQTDVYDQVHRGRTTSVRMMEGDSDNATVSMMEGKDMLSPARAFHLIDSAYSASYGSDPGTIPAEVARALNNSLIPNYRLDSITDDKYRSQEYLTVTGALGVIKKGQRIVDRGEIIDAQIFTNLNTYQEILERNSLSSSFHSNYFIGQILYILLCFLILYLFLKIYRPEVYNSLRHITFLVSFLTLFMVYALVMFEFVNSGLTLVPMAVVPVVVLVFIDSRTAIFSLLVAVLLTAMVATFPFQFIFMQLITGIFCTYSLRQLSKRSQLLRTAWISFISYIVCLITLSLLINGNLSDLTWKMVTYYAINSVVMSFAYVLIFIVEKIFGFTSLVTLVELSDINSPILRRLAEEAPGTFQHSMQVSTLAAEAARAIDANTQLVRTGALYHDIGKLESPVFFTENQHGVNPHSGLDPETSARKIISHISGGLSLATKIKLPTVLRSFISEHHGKGVTRYFYNTAVNNSNGEEVDIEKFRYPGPNPRSKETAILMMADSVEAASRSLKDYSAKSIDALVDKIIDTQQSEGLFKESPISFRDVETIKNTFKKRLATIYHSRIAYPEIKKS